MDDTLIAQDAYNKIAEQYAAEAPSNAYNSCYERPATISLLPPVRDRDVLDAGCGPGIYAAWLAAQGARVTAVDASAQMITLARARLPSSVRLIEANIADPLLELASGSFDLVVSPLVLDSIRDWRRPFATFHRVLREHGRLVFSVGHPMADFEMSPSGNYFSVECVSGEWKSYRVTVPAFRRPFGEIFDSLRDSGFQLDRFLEPRPTEECRLKFPEVYERLSTKPWFLCVSARRT